MASKDVIVHEDDAIPSSDSIDLAEDNGLHPKLTFSIIIF